MYVWQILESKICVYVCMEKDCKDLYENVNSSYIWVIEIELPFLKVI